MVTGQRAVPASGDRARGFIAGEPLRALGATLVFTYHAFFLSELVNSHGGTSGSLWLFFSILGNAGNISLFMFMSLSGYLLARPFIAAVVEGRPVPNVLTYARNRVLRVVPGLWVIFTLIWVRYAFLPSDLPQHLFRPDLLDQGAVYALVQIFHDSPSALLVGQAWTVDMEAQFYIFLPLFMVSVVLLARRVKARTMRVALLAGAIAIVGVASVAIRELSPPAQEWRRAFPTLAFAFIPGIGLALFEVAVRPSRLPKSLLSRTALAMPVATLILLVVAVATDTRVPMYSPAAPLTRPLLATLAAATYLAGPLAWQWAGRGAWTMLDNAPMRWLGARSYSFYIWHQAILAQVLAFSKGVGIARAFLTLMLVGLPLTIAATTITYALVERRFLNLRGRWRQDAKTTGREPSVSPAAPPS